MLLSSMARFCSARLSLFYNVMTESPFSSPKKTDFFLSIYTGHTGAPFPSPRYSASRIQDCIPLPEGNRIHVTVKG